MGFFKDLFVSLFSGLATVFIKGRDKNTGITINNNKEATLKDITARGQVTIKGNEGIEIVSGNFDSGEPHG